MNDHERDLEIEKTISLLQLAPGQLVELKEKGKCHFDLNEQLFDYDFPGHYCRKIKSIAILIPAVVGPYQNIKATLRQTSSRVLLKPEPKVVESLLTGKSINDLDPNTLRSNYCVQQGIAISKGADNYGMFELNFRDERYLPFEDTGAVSSWELEMPKAANRFDFNSISDVIIHLRYTARNGGKIFRSSVVQALRSTRRLSSD